MIRRTLLAGLTVASLLVVSTPVAVGQGHLEPGEGIDSAPDVVVGTEWAPQRYSVSLTPDQPAYVKVDIPAGHRLQVGFSVDPSSDSQLSADLIDAHGYLSDFDVLGSQNEGSHIGLRHGFLNSEPMNPANRSWGEDTYVRLLPTGTQPFEARVAISVVPEVVDGGALADLDRPPLRYDADVEAVEFGDPVTLTAGTWTVDATELDGTTQQTIEAGATQAFEVPVGWMQAVDATAEIVDGAAGGELSFSMLNAQDMNLTVVGQPDVASDYEGTFTFGQRAPGHYKNIAAKNKTRETGYIADYVYLLVTNTADESLTYRVAVEQRGEGVAPGPAFDGEAAARAAEEVEPVEKDMFKASGHEESTWQRALRDPIAWLAVLAALIAAVAVVVAVRRR